LYPHSGRRPTGGRSLAEVQPQVARAERRGAAAHQARPLAVAEQAGAAASAAERARTAAATAATQERRLERERAGLVLVAAELVVERLVVERLVVVRARQIVDRVERRRAEELPDDLAHL